MGVLSGVCCRSCSVRLQRSHQCLWLSGAVAAVAGALPLTALCIAAHLTAVGCWLRVGDMVSGVLAHATRITRNLVVCHCQSQGLIKSAAVR